MANRERNQGSPRCLLLHGLGGGPYELEPVTKALQTAGCRVEAPVLPGHEGPGAVMPASSWREWTQSAESWYDELTANGPPAAVVGFSTGALIALYLASTRKVDRLVLLAPFLAIRYTGWMPFRPSPILRALARWSPDLPRRRPAVRDAEMKRKAAALDRFRTFNLHAAVSALELIDEVKARVPLIDVPVLIIQGSLDSIVEPSGATWLRNHLGSSNKRLIQLPHSDHLVALDLEREQVTEAVCSFIADHEGGTLPSKESRES